MASLFLTALRKEARIARKKVSIPIVRKKSELEKVWIVRYKLAISRETRELLVYFLQFWL